MSHAVGTNRGQGQAECNLLPMSIFRRELGVGHALAADQKYARALARQLNYSNANWTHWADGGDGYVGPGWGEFSPGFTTVINVAGSNIPLFVVDSRTMPPKKVWLVHEEATEGGKLKAEEELKEEATLQALLAAVPMPDLSKVAFGQIGSSGTDQKVVIWDKATGNMWEFHRIAQFQAGALKGEWKAGNGSYHNASTWSGIGSFANGGSSASYLSTFAGTISLQDLMQVLRGGGINHMLSMAAVVTGGAAGHVVPAITGDTRENQTVEYENASKEKVANPAHGTVDQIPQGICVTYPWESRAGEWEPLAGKPLISAVYEAIRKYGLIVRDSGPTCSIYLEDWHSIRSPYSFSKGWPLASYEGAGASNFAEVNAAIAGTGWEDKSLPALTENLTGASGVLYKLFQATAQGLKQVETFSS
jgi:hypothetical protein